MSQRGCERKTGSQQVVSPSLHGQLNHCSRPPASLEREARKIRIDVLFSELEPKLRNGRSSEYCENFYRKILKLTQVTHAARSQLELEVYSAPVAWLLVAPGTRFEVGGNK